ncbi:MAG TPA: hypothetical protein VEM59_09410 [Acidimicrobiia bacterium]|nr:hypothetical protein [Acidimicrobiia bacterium]
MGTREITGAVGPPWIAKGVAGSVVDVVVVAADVEVVVEDELRRRPRTAFAACAECPPEANVRTPTQPPAAPTATKASTPAMSQSCRLREA